MPGSLLCRYSPVPGRSVAPSWVTRYCSGVRRAIAAASFLYSVIGCSFLGLSWANDGPTMPWPRTGKLARARDIQGAWETKRERSTGCSPTRRPGNPAYRAARPVRAETAGVMGAGRCCDHGLAMRADTSTGGMMTESYLFPREFGARGYGSG